MNSILRNTLATIAAATALCTSMPSLALSNTGKVPILLYHPHEQTGCTYETNALIALEQDLETIWSQGFTVMPVYWIAEWVVSDRDGSTLPEHVVGITFDDGADLAWVDGDPMGCGTARSARSVLLNFKANHPTLPALSPHASAFVIASQIARGAISSATGVTMTDSWWSSANASGIMEIYNHSADHDHASMTFQQYDPFLAAWLPAGGGAGQEDFYRIDTYGEADVEVRKAGIGIASVIGGRPDLFAYPWGMASTYMVNTYFPTYTTEHLTYAAFGTDPAYATRSSNRYFVPRYVQRGAWTSQAGLISILSGAL